MTTENPFIVEFYNNQKRFHTDMGNLVKFIEQRLIPNVAAYLSEPLREYLKPYKELVDNPFGDIKGSDRESLEHINTVINSPTFAKMNAAYLEVSNKYPEFLELLAHIDTSKLEMRLVDGRTRSVKNELIKPSQNATRYLLTIREIDKVTTRAIDELNKNDKAYSDDEMNKKAQMEFVKNEYLSPLVASASKLVATLDEKTNNLKKSGQLDKTAKTELTKTRTASRTNQRKASLSASSLFSGKKGQLRDMQRGKKELNEEMQRFAKENKSKGPK